MSSAVCARCGAPRLDGPECPKCGVIYARAERRAAAERQALTTEAADASEAVEDAPDAPYPQPSAAAVWAAEHDLQAARTELWLARFAVPGMLLLWFVLVQAELGRFLARTFFGMWLHELGHAAAAWLCGFPAIPGPWFTSVDEERSFFFALMITAGLGYAAWRAWTDEDRHGFVAAAAVLVAQLFATFALSVRAARTFITFAGDAGSLLFGAAFLAAFFVPPGHKFHRDWLRWGFLVIGAASFADTFREWWTARTDPSVIPFGEFEYGEPTDPTKLVVFERWTVPSLIRRYLGVGLVGLVALVPLQILHIRRTRDALAALEADETRRNRRF